jgi:DNA-binding response OmpR family regulator
MTDKAMKTKKTPHILIVDDDPIVLKVLTHELSRENYEITTADSGEKALLLLDMNPSNFSVVILDRKMEPISGLDVLHEIHRNPALKKIPMIMLTSHAEATHKIAATIAGAFDILIKPENHEWDSLLMAIKRALREK